MSIKTEVMNIVPEFYLGERTIETLEVIDLTYDNGNGSISNSMAARAAEAVTRMVMLMQWSFTEVPVGLQDELNKVRAELEGIISDMRDGDVEIIRLSNAKDNLRKLFTYFNDLRTNKRTA